MLFQILVFLASLFFLSEFSRETVKASIKLSKLTRLEELSIGLILLSILTSLPEIAVSTAAMVSKHVEISLGNIFGSNIANICLVLGLSSLFFPLYLTEDTLEKILNMLTLTIAIILLFLTLATASRTIGFVLLLVFICYAFYSTKKRITIKKLTFRPTTFLERILKPVEIYKQIFILSFSVFGVIFFSNFLVVSASNIAFYANIPETLLGATLIALGTSLPELSLTFAALKKRHVNLALGNIIGSCLVNLTLVLGTTLLISTFRVKLIDFSLLVGFSLVSALLLWFFLGIRGRKILERSEGIFLLLVYILFITLSSGIALKV